MKILAIDTAGNHCALSLWEDKNKIASVSPAMERGHAANLPPLCQALLEKTETPLNLIDQILVNIGPGSFTGIRVGLSFAQGLAQSMNIPLQGILGFDAALADRPLKNQAYLVILDARRHDYYCQLILDGQKQTPLALSPLDITALIEHYSPILLGNGVPSFSSALGLSQPTHEYSAGADGLVKAFHGGCAQAPRAFYLRQPDVTRTA